MFRSLVLSAFAGLVYATAGAQAAESPEDLLRQGHELYTAGDLGAARQLYAKLVADTTAKPELRSIAQLRIAQSYRRASDLAAAEVEYAKVVASTDSPLHHRAEAEAAIQELQRLRAGQPARDPAASRIQPPKRPEPGVTLVVSPAGTDTHPGTAAQPFATLARARDEIRAIKNRGGLPAGGIRVVIHGGRYSVPATFALANQDSGTESSPIVYQAAEGEDPVFSGGVSLTQFVPVSDPTVLSRIPEEARDKVVQADLSAHGIRAVPPVRFGGFASGRGFQSHPGLELFYDGRAMPLSRWPNEGFVQITEVRGITELPSYLGKGFKEGILAYAGDRPKRWSADPDIVLYGYWYWGWADSYESVASIDVEKQQINLAEPFHRYGYRSGQPFRAMNLLSEIDQPGEWYLDRRSMQLYFYPPGDLAAANVEVSVAAHPFVELRDVTHVSFEKLTWELGCTDAILIRGGDHCLLAGCTIRRFAGNEVDIQGGVSHGLLSCDIHSLGRGGVVLSAGDRKRLTPANYFVENCHIADLSRLDRTYTPAILCGGVGHRIAHNLLHDVPSSAMRVNGNDHRVEWNEIARVVLESDDQGGVDMFGNPTFRGNEFRFNYFHHIGSWRDPSNHPDCGQAGIRLDDMISGTLVYGNVFRRCAAGKLGFGGVQVHGGKDNILDNNLFVECTTAVSFSPWGESRWHEQTADALASSEIDAELYLNRYPDLARLREGVNVNQLWRNLIVACGEPTRRDRGAARLLDNSVVAESRSLPGVAAGSFELDWQSPLLNDVTFQPLPFNEIGLYVDAYRKELPQDVIARLRAGGE